MFTRHYVLFQLSNLQIHYVGSIPFSFHEKRIMIIFSQKTFTNWSDREALQKRLKRIINVCFLRDHDSVRKVAMLNYSRALHNALYIKFRTLLARESLFTRGKSFSRRNEVLDKLSFIVQPVGRCLRSLCPYFPSRPFTRKKGLLLDDWIRAWQVLAVKPIVGLKWNCTTHYNTKWIVKYVLSRTTCCNGSAKRRKSLWQSSILFQTLTKSINFSLHFIKIFFLYFSHFKEI